MKSPFRSVLLATVTCKLEALTKEWDLGSCLLSADNDGCENQHCNVEASEAIQAKAATVVGSENAGCDDRGFRALGMKSKSAEGWILR